MQGTWGHRVSVVRRALLPEQIEEHQLPPDPAKVTDSRTIGFRAAHGNDTVELDALPPEVLAEYVEAAVMEFVDDHKDWDKQKRLERDEQAQLDDFVDRIGEEE